MRLIAVSNQKGGSGKTTTSVNLAGALGEMGKRVLVVDLDAQANASTWFGIRDGGRDLMDTIMEGGNLEGLVREGVAPGVDLIPSSNWLVGLERQLAGEVGAESVFLRIFSRLPERWDFVLLDCPPALGLVTVNALVAVEELLIPVEAHVLALNGLAQLTQTVDKVKERLNPDLRISGIVPCRVDSRTRHALEVVENIREHFGKTVTKTIIRENIRLAEAPAFAQPITQYDTRSAGAEDYRSLAREFMRRR